MNADFSEMLDHLSEAIASTQVPPDAEPGDLLTQILLGLRLDGVDYNRCLHHAPWAVAIPAKPSASFHFVSQGGAWLRTAKSDWLPLQAGDAVLLPHGSFHVMASAPDLPAIDIESLARKPVADKLFLIDSRDQAHADAPPTHVLFGGAMRFNLDPLHPLLSMMPEVMVAGNLSARDATVPALLDAMEREVALNRIGGCGILARLADALAACIIRAWVECSCKQPTGWIAAVRCPRIGRVIAAIHAAPEKPWTVPELARVMGASRSTFAEAFSRTMGESPAQYVAKIKMFQARQWLAQDRMRIAVVADRLGYESEASFSRAFKRIIGHAPSVARAEALAA